jgi:hypothetical protein
MKTNLTIPPVLFLVYKRPAITKLVFDEIRKAKPKKLFIGADGPKANNREDIEKVNEVRKIVQNVDWDCEVKTHFQEKNVGSKVAESSAIKYFFENVEEGIILEDDCLPNQSFFGFCQELLEKYRDDKRVMHISGNNFQFGRQIGDGSYYFSRFNFGWGWATWKRAWKCYDVNMGSYPKFKSQGQIKNIFSDNRIQQYYLDIFDRTHDKNIDCWDYQWTYAIWSQNGLCVVPNENLVSNIGFGADGTYCTDENAVVANIKTNTIEKVIHPEFMLPNKDADTFSFEKFNTYPTFLQRLKKFIKKNMKFINCCPVNL